MDKTKQNLQYFLKVLALFAVYFSTAKLGLKFDAVSGFATLVWPPTGISLAVLLIFGRHLWPGILLGAFTVNLETGAPLLSAMGMGIGNTLEAVTGAYLLQRFVKFQNNLAGIRSFGDSVSDVLGLILFGAVLSTLVSATIGVASLWLGGVISLSAYFSTWQAWWVGDMLGDLIIAPLILAWWRSKFSKISLNKILEAGVLVLVLVAFSIFIFVDLLSIKIQNFPVEYLVFPLLIWASFRFGQHGAVTGTFAISFIAIWGTSRGFGPFARPTLSESLIFLQLFMGVAATTSMILAAVVIERKKAEKVLWGKKEELKRLTEELSRSNQELEQFAYMVSHDLKEPLRMVSGFTNLLTKRYKGTINPNADEFITYIIEGTARMQGLIDDILEYSRVNKYGKSFKWTDCTAVVTSTISNMSVAIEERGALITYDENLPVVMADYIQLMQLFQNLIDNAIKFQSDNKPQVHIGAEQRNSEWIFSVRDNGIGIEPESAKQIFDLFQRLHSRGEYSGTGLGLAICKKIVERHDGRIWVESEPGFGSTFYFTIPV